MENKNERKIVWDHKPNDGLEDIINELSNNTKDSDTNDDLKGIASPIVQQVFNKTISDDLITVQPMQYPGGIDQEKLEELKSIIKSENREGIIESILNGEEYEFKELEDDDRYKELLEFSGTSGKLFYYIDYKYNTDEDDTKE